MLRFTLLVLASLTMSGCVLTRVSDASHAKAVRELNAVGLSLDAAREVAIEKGYDCETQPDLNRSVQTKDGVRKTNILQCNKSSMELICPQRRYVVFNVDPQTGKVYAVGNRITQQSCF